MPSNKMRLTECNLCLIVLHDSNDTTRALQCEYFALKADPFTCLTLGAKTEANQHSSKPNALGRNKRSGPRESEDVIYRR